jgi:hypothetical protein
MLAISDARKIAIFAALKSASSPNACAAMKSDMVNPIPPSAPAPRSCRHE